MRGGSWQRAVVAMVLTCTAGACASETTTPGESNAADTVAVGDSTIGADTGDTTTSDSGALDSGALSDATVPTDTATMDTAAPDDTAAPEDADGDTVQADTAAEDIVQIDAIAEDTTRIDAVAEDTLQADTVAEDTTAEDTTAPDTTDPICTGDGACDDGNPCTEDSCQPGVGCSSVPVSGACADSAPPLEANFVGVWHADTTARRIFRNQTWTQLETTWSAQSGAGWRLMDVEVRATEGGASYDSIYAQRGGGYALYSTTNEADFDAQVATWSDLQLVDFEVVTIGAQRRLVGVWLGSGGSTLVRDLSWDDLVATRASQHAASTRLVDLEVEETDGGRRYHALFHAGTGRSALWVGPRWDTFASKVVEFDHMKLVDVEVYGSATAPRYAGVWVGDADAELLIGGQPWSRFSAADAAAEADGQRIVDLERYEGLPVTPVAWAASIHDDLEDLTVGYSHALAHRGVIVGYGQAGDARATWESSNAGVDYTVTKRSHVASVSKVITSTAMMVADIDFDQAFYPLLKDQYPTVGDGVDTVTIRELVTHRSGMDPLGLGGKRCGPNFSTTIANLIAADVVEPPGRYSYANTNFCLARAVLEAVTGQDYVTWVNNNMFRPMGVTGLSAKPDTVTPMLYYQNASGAVLESAGFLWTTDYTPEAGAYGWYASSSALIRWLIGLRNHTVIAADDTERLFDENLGWLDTSTTRGTASWHNGGWGTGDGRGLKTCVMRLPDGYDAVILMNTRPNSAKDALVNAFNAMFP